MECKLPIKGYNETFKSRQNIEIPVIDNIPTDTKAYSHISETWKQFGKWLVVIEESKEKVSKGGLNHNHVCVVLKSVGFTFYFYELIDNYTEDQLDAFRYLRLLLDGVLVANQVSGGKLKYYLQQTRNWQGEVFPRFLRQFPENKIARWSDKIDAEIEEWSNKKFDLSKVRDIKRRDYWNKIAKPNNYNIKGYYGEILSVFNTLKPDLPQENIMIIDDMIERFEHGYHLGYLTDRSIKDFTKKLGSKAGKSKSFLMDKLKKFRIGREDRIIKASKQAFEWNDDVRRKLNRMFEFKKV
jgi:hypothetical protein